MKDRPQLLFVAPWFLFPPVSGGRIRTVDVLRGMKGGRFRITLASPAPSDGKRYSAELDSVCDHFRGWHDDTDRSTLARLSALRSRYPVSVALDQSGRARAAIATEIAKGPDIVVLDFVHTAIVTPEEFPMPAVLFTHNVESEIYARQAQFAASRLKRLIWRGQAIKMEEFEHVQLRRFDTVVAVSERDRETFSKRLGHPNVVTIPTGVDLEFHSFQPAKRRGNLLKSGGRLVFTGSMDWLPNVEGLTWFLESVWPRIAAQSPETEMVVIGRDPSPKLIAAVESAGVPWEFTGRVPDVRPFVHSGDVYVIPLRVGGGTRLKAFEAMALGRPVVSTTLGVEGLVLEEGRHYLRADTAEDFASCVLRLLGDEAQRRTLAELARGHVEANFSSSSVARRFEEICVAAIEERARR